MKVKEIYSILDEEYHFSSALSWDNVGLLLGDMEKDVKKIVISLDATSEVINKSIDEDCNLLITHHPLLFSPVNKITCDDYIGNRIIKILSNNISYIAMHTNYDQYGMGKLAAKILGLPNSDVLEITHGELDEAIGIGEVGDLKETTTLGEYTEVVKKAFHLPSLTVFGDKNKPVKRVAISPGSGKSMVDVAVEKGADLLITGDIGHHDGLDSIEKELSVIDAGHYGIEKIFMEDVKGYLETKLQDVKVEIISSEAPFHIE
ncbi:MAG: Nif3-like dinuclear metal center hexameric protein [Lachnospiraceae bacterium]|jgi:dinuclear metal center YbgI/SA1388 family protein|nr:Nif3-like dinuclear metal center hexameric protein [Lachnospiraceae bacterium]